MNIMKILTVIMPVMIFNIYVNKNIKIYLKSMSLQLNKTTISLLKQL